MKIKLRCPKCQWEVETDSDEVQLKECPVCKYSVQKEGADLTKKILKG